MTQQVALGDMHIRLHGKPVRLENHPLYSSLRDDDSKPFASFMRRSSEAQRKKRSGSWSGFRALAASIRSKGFVASSSAPMVLKVRSDGRVCCTHGRHRCCILLHVYGPEARLMVRKHQRGDQPKYRVVGVYSDKLPLLEV